jgi:hypothetical protein
MKSTLAVTTPGDTEILMSRVFDAPRRLVWDAVTRPVLSTLSACGGGRLTAAFGPDDPGVGASGAAAPGAVEATAS